MYSNQLSIGAPIVSLNDAHLSSLVNPISHSCLSLSICSSRVFSFRFGISVNDTFEFENVKFSSGNLYFGFIIFLNLFFSFASSSLSQRSDFDDTGTMFRYSYFDIISAGIFASSIALDTPLTDKFVKHLIRSNSYIHFALFITLFIIASHADFVPFPLRNPCISSLNCFVSSR